MQMMRVILLSLVYPLQYPLVGLVQSLGQFVKILTEVRGEGMLQCIQLAECPSEPVQQCENLLPASNNMAHLHPIGSFRQRLDHEILIIRPPSPHRHAWGRANDVSNVAGDVRFLSAFVV